MKLYKFEKTLKDKKILVTGHTGFTGSWLCQWLINIGAKVNGYALEPKTYPSLFNLLDLEKRMDSYIGDITRTDILHNYVEKVQPDLIIHLAAQPLVTDSYLNPLETYSINTMGTANVLEVARNCSSVQAIVCITTDKVYENNEDNKAYAEAARLGGKDPYSASKSAAELIIESYKYAFSAKDEILIASARGGNIIGGGDWSANRLIPDIVRAITSGNTLNIRYPNSTRPWQHVLGLVYGYLLLSADLLNNNYKSSSAWNFGPVDSKSYSVQEILDLAFSQWAEPNYKLTESDFAEAGYLRLDSSKAKDELFWYPPWNTKKAIKETFNWYKEFYKDQSSVLKITNSQIEDWRSEISSK